MKTASFRLNLILLVIFTLLVAGCSKKDSEAPSAAQNGPSPADTVEAASGTPAARVNDVEISTSDLDRAILGIILKNGMDPSQVPLFRKQFGPRILDQLVQEELLRQEAAGKGYTALTEEVDTAISGFSANFPSQDEFHAAMTERGLTEQTLRENLEKQIAIRKYIEGEIVPQAVVPEEDVREAFDSDPASFRVPEEVRASHILIQVADTDPQEKKDEALERAKEVASLARREGANFAQLAKEYSEGPTAPSGGDLGFFRRGRMVKPFEETAFTLEIGTVSEPVLTQFGYHVITVTEKREERSLPFEEVRGKLAENLKNRMIGELVAERIQDLQEASRIEILLEAGPEPRNPPQ